MVENGAIIGLLALIATIDLAQFAVVLEHRGRLASVEERLEDPMRADGGLGPDGPTEDSTDRDGFLSYAAEWHAFSLGVYDGMRDWRVRPGDRPENDDVEAEPHYYTGGYAIGTLLQGSIVVAGAVWTGAVELPIL